MNCDEYIAQFLSADADDQLSESERRLVEEHLRGCAHCRAQLSEELALKASIRLRMGGVKTPPDVRLQIRAALGEAAERSMRPAGMWAHARTSLRGAARNSSRETANRAVSARRRLAIQLKSVRHLAPAGFAVVVLAALTVMFWANFSSLSGPPSPYYQRPIPAFDFAISRFSELSQEFNPNVPAEAFSPEDGAYFAWVEDSDPLRHVSVELPDISASYEKMRMPAEFCDFALAGYELVGGRIDHMPNGQPVTYTLYRNRTKSILSIGLKQRISAPQDGYWFSTHALYSYRGYSICLTIYPVGHFASIIIAHVPMVELLRDVAVSDVTF